MKIQASDINPGDRIIAYFKNKMQVFYFAERYGSETEGNPLGLGTDTF